MKQPVENDEKPLKNDRKTPTVTFIGEVTCRRENNWGELYVPVICSKIETTDWKGDETKKNQRKHKKFEKLSHRSLFTVTGKEYLGERTEKTGKAS